ncbi:MAG TPA: VacJ family lipoprotein [Steroidobacteraceae bacterium]|nr:VacJ family lipoprotein [Steroidobacteraceae bacterium]
MASTIRPSLLALGLLLLLGCATLPPGKRDPRDPWERMNRATYRFNDTFDRAIFRPVARGYRKVTPHFVQTGVSNFFDNLEYPVVMVNDLLQGQIGPFFSDTGRLLLNTTVGIGGLMDPATRVGLDKNDRDFGQTLGKWGVSTGPYLVIPILGPSDARDAVGRVGDEYSNPRHYIRDTYVDYGLALLRAIDTRARLLDAQGAIDSAYDPYAFVRNVYLQHRAFKVNGGQSADEEQQEQKLLEESEQDMPAGTAAPPPAPPPQAPPPH